MSKNIEAIKKQEKILRETLFIKTTELLNHVLTYVPTSTVLLVNDVTTKVICGSDGKKSLLMNNHPFSTASDCEWVIESFDALLQAVEELMSPEAEEMLKIIKKTEDLIKKVDDLTPEALK